MAVVQSAYPNVHGSLVLGQIASTSTRDVDSFTADETIPFGCGVGRTATGVELGAAREIVGTTDAAMLAADTAVDITIPADAARYSQVLVSDYYLLEEEIVIVWGADADGINSMERGYLGTTAADHASGTILYRLQGGNLFAGVAIMDERTRASSPDGEYAAGEIISVLYRGDVAVRVAHAVNAGETASLVVAAGDNLGTFTNLPSDHDNIQIAGAEFLTSAAADGIAVVRLMGPTTGVSAQTH